MDNMVIGVRELTRNMSGWLDRSSNDKMNIVIKRTKGEDMMLVPLSEYSSLEETAYLLKSPANAAHLARGIKSVEDMIATGKEVGKVVSNFDEIWK
ncbi:antitoxin YefM [Bacteroidia bacterium]|nr:antitoxin YefM [Bacteroidia bacterium]